MSWLRFSRVSRSPSAWSAAVDSGYMKASSASVTWVKPAAQGLIHTDLEQVLELGTPPHPTVAAEAPKARGTTPQERREAARLYLEANEAWFLEQKTKRDERRFFHKGADGRADAGVPTMELADLFCKCYSELHKLLETDGPRGSVV